jgi:hypothetical protein
MRSARLIALLILGAAACARQPAPPPPAKLLGNPVLDARAALAAGDSTFLGLLDPDLRLPGLDAIPAALEGERVVRVFSQRSLGLGTGAWAAQRDSLRVYAAVYNLIVREARGQRVRSGI